MRTTTVLEAKVQITICVEKVLALIVLLVKMVL